MFDIGMAELLVIGVVALIVVGPKDLPGMFRTVGQFVGKARGMARDFQNAMDQAADDSGMADVAKDLKQATSMKNLGLDDVKDAVKSYSDNYQTQAESKKVDAAAEHAERVSKANQAAEQWPPEGVTLPEETPEPAETTPAAAEEKPATKAALTAKKPAPKKSAPKKPAANDATGKSKA